MKYSRRELKTFNVFALLLLGLGGFFFILGVIEFVFQPTQSYTVARPYSQVDSRRQLTEESAVLPSEKAGTVSEEDSADIQSRTARSRPVQETVMEEGLNFKAVSNVLLGTVFLVLSFGLNFMLLRVIRRNGRDREKVTGDR